MKRSNMFQKKRNTTHIYFIILPILLVFTGCSSNYTINDFPSKEKFYDSFNNFVKNKDIKVTLTDGSSFNVLRGAVLEYDTLFTIKELEQKKYRSLALSDLKKINYTSNDYKSAYILRNNGEGLNCENIIIEHDSISFNEIENGQTRKSIVAVNNVREISYKDRWIRTPLGILIGGAVGLASGLFYTSKLQDSKDDAGLSTGVGIVGTLIGAAAGGVIGYIIGFDYNYQFNQ
jgi:hypothetical protein